MIIYLRKIINYFCQNDLKKTKKYILSNKNNLAYGQKINKLYSEKLQNENKISK